MILVLYWLNFYTFYNKCLDHLTTGETQETYSNETWTCNSSQMKSEHGKYHLGLVKARKLVFRDTITRRMRIRYSKCSTAQVNEI